MMMMMMMMITLFKHGKKFIAKSLWGRVQIKL